MKIVRKDNTIWAELRSIMQVAMPTNKETSSTPEPADESMSLRDLFPNSADAMRMIPRDENGGVIINKSLLKNEKFIEALKNAYDEALKNVSNSPSVKKIDTMKRAFSGYLNAGDQKDKEVEERLNKKKSSLITAAEQKGKFDPSSMAPMSKTYGTPKDQDAQPLESVKITSEEADRIKKIIDLLDQIKDTLMKYETQCIKTVYEKIMSGAGTGKRIEDLTWESRTTNEFMLEDIITRDFIELYELLNSDSLKKYMKSLGKHVDGESHKAALDLYDDLTEMDKIYRLARDQRGRRQVLIDRALDPDYNKTTEKKEENYKALVKEFGEDLGEMTIDKHFFVNEAMKSFMKKTGEIIESLGPAEAKAYGEKYKGHIDNSGRVFVNGKEITMHFIDGVQMKIHELADKLSISTNAELVKKITGMDPLHNSGHAVIFKMIDAFLHDFSKEHYEKMKLKEAVAELKSKYPPALVALFTEMIKNSEKYIPEQVSMDRPIEIEPGGSVKITTDDDGDKHVMLVYNGEKFAPLPLSAALRWAKMSTKTFNDLLESDMGQAARILYEAMMKFNLVQELSDDDEVRENPSTSKFSSSRFFGSISKDITDADRRVARMHRAMIRIAKIFSDQDLQVKRDILAKKKDDLEMLQISASEIPGSAEKVNILQKEISSLEKQIADYESQPRQDDFEHIAPQQNVGHELNAPEEEAEDVGELVSKIDTLLKRTQTTRIDAGDYKKMFDNLVQAKHAAADLERQIRLETAMKSAPEQVSGMQANFDKLEKRIVRLETELHKYSPKEEPVDSEDSEAMQRKEKLMDRIFEKRGINGLVDAYFNIDTNRSENVKNARKNLEIRPNLKRYIETNFPDFINALKTAEKELKIEKIRRKK